MLQNENEICILHRTRTQFLGQTRNGLRGRSISQYIQKLKAMVPTIERDEKLDEFEILQRVIEYIQLLEEALGLSDVVNSEHGPI